MGNLRQRVTVLDLQMKRKSGSCNADVSGGSAFLNPGRLRNDRIPFFRRPDIDLSVRDITVRINSLTPDQQIVLAQKLGLRPTQAALWSFMRGISLSDKQVTRQIQSILTELEPSKTPRIPPPGKIAVPSITQPLRRKETRTKGPKLGPISSYPFVDIRYGYCEEEGLILKDAALIGLKKYGTHLTVPDLPPSRRAVIQCFAVGMVPAIVRWPSTSRVVVNDVPVKLPGVCNFALIDTSDFGERPDIDVMCDEEGAPYALVVRVAEYRSFSDLATQVMTKHVDESPFTGTIVPSVMDPVSGKLMKHPGKGVNCHHDQCFDIKQYIKRSNMTRQWLCPVCNRSLPYQELRYCSRMAEVISGAKSQKGSPTMVAPPEAPPSLFDGEDALSANSDGDVFPELNEMASAWEV